MAAATPSTGQPTTGSKVRVGIYDNRAIAIAYAASSFDPVSGKMKEYEAAKQAGDKKRVKELESWGKAHQRLLHFPRLRAHAELRTCCSR